MSISTENWAKITRGTAEIISEAELKKKLAKGKPLRVKLGVDPTAPDLHLGHFVVLRKLRHFQDLGHTVEFIIGDFTARIGDPSGQSQLRPQLAPAQIDAHAATYLDQVFQVLDRQKTVVRRNSEWLENKKDPLAQMQLLSRLFQRASVQQLLERDDFTKRRDAHKPVYMSELMYPLLQGYDSVAVEADVELGGTDQLFNLLMGREIQTDFSQEPQVVMTLPLLEGLDGTRKMSKSYGNYVAFRDPPAAMFGKLMSVPDALMPKYVELLTDLDVKQVSAMHPRDAKELLGKTITGFFHGAKAAESAADEFKRVFSKKEAPADVPEHRIAGSTIALPDLLVQAGLAPSKKEARRLLSQGAVEADGKRVGEKETLTVSKPVLLQVGKRRFARILPA